MKHILLHVGTHKTGSTTIQETLFANRERLAGHGIHYLSIGANHWDLYSAFMEEPWEWFENRRRGLDKQQVLEKNQRALRTVEAEIQASDARWVIISAEHFSMLPPERIAAFRDWLAPLGDVQVVYYARQIEAWLASDSQQCAKVGIRGRPTPYKVAIQRLYDFPIAWMDAFGKQRVRLLRFEDAVTGGLTNSLLAVAGLPSIEQMGIDERRFNESISAEAVECFFRLNHLAPVGSGQRNRRLVEALMALPGGKYRAGNLSAEQVEDHNRKMNHLRGHYRIDLYPSLRYQGEGDGRSPFSVEAIDHLLGLLNDTMNQLDAMEQEAAPHADV